MAVHPGFFCEVLLCVAIAQPAACHHVDRCRQEHARIQAQDLSKGRESWYPLVNKHNDGKSPFLLWVNQLQMAMFNSYVSLPEGKPKNHWDLRHQRN